MELSYKQVEKILMSYFRILPDRDGTFRSRIKQLQRMEFPQGVNVGRGTKMLYGGEHLFKLVSAFELIGAGLPAQAATTFVDRHWWAFSGALALSALQNHWGFDEEPIEVYLAIIIEAMHDIQFKKSAWPPPSINDVRIVDYGYILTSISGSGSKDRSFQSYLSVTQMLNKVIEIGTTQAGAVMSQYDDELMSWLPKGKSFKVHFLKRYPDLTNIEMRQQLHHLYGTDPDSLTEVGQQQAERFRENLVALTI